MITVCVPTRGRPDQFRSMVVSALQTAHGPIEISAWLDEDDPTADQYPKDLGVRYGQGPRVYRRGVLVTSELWTRAWRNGSGDIAMLAADDVQFVTPGWDAAVVREFDRVPDRILMVYCDSRSGDPRPIMPFVSREWIDAVGWFTPPDWPGWFSDAWIWTLAAEVRRVVYLDHVMIRHLRPRRYQYVDQTYREGAEARLQLGGVRALRERFYGAQNIKLRDEQKSRLMERMVPDIELVPDPVPDWFTVAVRRSAEGRNER